MDTTIIISGRDFAAAHHDLERICQDGLHLLIITAGIECRPLLSHAAVQIRAVAEAPIILVAFLAEARYCFIAGGLVWLDQLFSTFVRVVNARPGLTGFASPDPISGIFHISVWNTLLHNVQE